MIVIERMGYGVWPMSATIVPTADGQRTVAFQQPVAQI